MGNAEIYDFENHIYLFFKLKKEKWNNEREKTSFSFLLCVHRRGIQSYIYNSQGLWFLKEMVAVINLGKFFLQTLGM